MVCYMYYTDVFVGSNNIEKLRKALEAVLNGFNSNDLTQLVHGLCLFMGYPSCLCSLKTNVDKSLKDISQKLLKDSEAVQSCVNSQTLNLNCDSCSSEKILCKCCVISCIKELPTQSKCKCVKNTSNSCQCSGTNGKCCKDFLSGLEACLSLLNLKTDLAVCNCKAPDCCNNGTCTNSKCNLCKPETSTITGLGLSRPNPVRLAKRLNEMLCGTQKAGQTCKCGCGSGTKNTSCCCFCHKGCTGKNLSTLCSKACTPGCSCASKPGTCPRHTFCKTLNDIKIPVGCGCQEICSGQKCPCHLGSGSCSSNCCQFGKAEKSLKCVIMRLLKFFEQVFSDTSKCFRLCCESDCLKKHCEAVKKLFDGARKDVCGKCKEKNQKGTKNCGCPQKSAGEACPDCCGEDPNCCKSCNECQEILHGRKLSKALEDLRLDSPCGQDLYRVLKDFLDYCTGVFLSKFKVIQDAVKSKHSPCCSTGQPCASDCQACKALRAHNDIMAILAGGYLSSYDSSKAKWNLLCPKSASKPCFGCLKSCPCRQTVPSSVYSHCTTDPCCPDCNVRSAAKIFLGFLPALYFGLKIVFDRCDPANSELWPGWQTKITQGSIQNFLFAWGFYGYLNPSTHAVVLPVFLRDLFSSESTGSFDKIYDFVSKEYFSPSVSPGSISPNSSPPTTVRQMLLWLYGLRFTSGFSSLVSRCKDLCSPFGNSFHPDAFCYYLHVSCFLLPASFISVIETSDSHISTFFSEVESLDFSYPEDPFKLFETFCDFVRKIYIPLTFIRFQCERTPGYAGWQSCWYGQKCAEKFKGNSLSSPPSKSLSSSSSDCSCLYSKAYLCTAINKDKVHDHCNGSASGQGCLGFDSSASCSTVHPPKPGSSAPVKCTPCPHPLMRFLCDSESQPKASPSLFKPPPGFPPMGFSGHLPEKAVQGKSLYHVIDVFCKEGFYPLTRLVQFALCISRRPPETFLELFVFFKKFVSSSVFKDHFVPWINGEPGTFPGDYLKGAVKFLVDSSDSHLESGGQTQKVHKNSLPLLADHYSLFGCDGPKGFTCGKYLFPLYNVDGLFAPELCDLYLSIVCHYAPKFKKEFESFYTAAKENFKCCLQDSSSCKKIVKCPCALPFLYRNGFSFWSPKGLNGTNKKSCQDFIAQLDRVVNGYLFRDLLNVIDAFLWSIRLPFIYAFLYIWILVISYFYYVQFYKLDLLHIDSHLHLSRSFKILPSTLFSDASSKLKDLSYFTL